jgi:putative heme iron utilization protein
MTPHPDPTPPADAAALAMVQALLRTGHAALSYIGEDGAAGISRIAFGHDGTGGMATFISALAPHLAGLQANPTCAVMLGEPGAKGDPLTHPRLMIRALAEFAAPKDRAALRKAWLEQHPKAKLYVDFADFAFVRLRPLGGLLNAGFGKAFTLVPADLAVRY